MAHNPTRIAPILPVDKSPLLKNDVFEWLDLNFHRLVPGESVELHLAGPGSRVGRVGGEVIHHLLGHRGVLGSLGFLVL